MNLQTIMTEAKTLREKNKISKNSIAVKMGIPAQRITLWESGRSRPRADFFIEYLNIIGYNFVSNK